MQRKKNSSLIFTKIKGAATLERDFLNPKTEVEILKACTRELIKLRVVYKIANILRRDTKTKRKMVARTPEI